MVTEGYSSLLLESGCATPFVTFGDSELGLLVRCRMIPGEYGSGLPPAAANHFENSIQTPRTASGSPPGRKSSRSHFCLKLTVFVIVEH